MLHVLAKMGIRKKPGTPSRRDFVRTKISRGENIASAVILLLIAGIGIAIAIKGAHFDPGLYEVRTGSLDATSAPVIGRSVTAPSSATAAAPAPAAVPDNTVPVAPPTTVAPPSTTAPSTDVESMQTPSTAAPSPGTASTSTAPDQGGGEGSGAAPQPAPTGPPMEIALAGIKPMGDTEFYSSDTLYEKIDGRSPAYQGFNVQQLRCRSFSVLAAAGSYVDVYEYRFDSPLDAFGMYALERDPKGKPTPFATDGYSGEMGYFFRQGPVYVQIIASDEKPETMAMATALAQNRAKELPVDDNGLAGRRELPSAGMVAGSVGFILDNAQGQSSLKNVFQAKYNFEGAQFPFFVMVATPDEASKAFTSFQAFCSRFGKTELLPDVNGGKVFRAQLFGKWKVIYVRNKELGGVFDATDANKASDFVEKYLQGEIK